MKKYIFPFLCLFISHGLFAQWKISAYQHFNSNTPTSQSNAKLEAVQLPFFDDFSLSTKNQPDATLWINSGTRVSNTITDNHPSVNVVSFDGLRFNGKPYDVSNELSNGSSDTLTSQAIDISKLNPSDSLYLSFFWQAKGLAELPDANDSLRVQLLTNGGLWRTVWVQAGGSKVDVFKQAMIPIRANFYFHGAFQFRFQSFGRQSGGFDTWHIDYVYLNKSRNAKDKFIKDISLRKPVTSILKKLNAMPLSHFLKNPSQVLADSVKSDIVNQFNNNNFTTFKVGITEQLSGKILQSFQDLNTSEIFPLAAQDKKIKLNLSNLALTGTRAFIKTKFEVQTTDNLNPSIVGINLTRNDTLSSIITLDNYYAYDDGSAEYAAGLNARLGRVVVRYVFAKEDNLTGVQFNFSQTLKDLSKQTFVVQILGNDKGKPGKVLYQKADSIRYSPNGFTQINFERAIAIKDTVFIGYLQLTDEEIAIGLDKNSVADSSDIYYNFGPEWIKNSGTDRIQGALMIRPIVGGQIKDVLTSTEPVIQEKELIVFPNPSAELIRWNDERYQQVEVLDMLGQVILKTKVAEPVVNISVLADGIYLIRLSNQEQSIVKKIIIRK